MFLFSNYTLTMETKSHVSTAVWNTVKNLSLLPYWLWINNPRVKKSKFMKCVNAYSQLYSWPIYTYCLQLRLETAAGLMVNEKVILREFHNWVRRLRDGSDTTFWYSCQHKKGGSPALMMVGFGELAAMRNVSSLVSPSSSPPLHTTNTPASHFIHTYSDQVQ